MVSGVSWNLQIYDCNTTHVFTHANILFPETPDLVTGLPSIWRREFRAEPQRKKENQLDMKEKVLQLEKEVFKIKSDLEYYKKIVDKLWIFSSLILFNIFAVLQPSKTVTKKKIMQPH